MTIDKLLPRAQGEKLSQEQIRALMQTPLEDLLAEQICFNCGIKYETEHDSGCCTKQCRSEYYANTAD